MNYLDNRSIIDINSDLELVEMEEIKGKCAKMKLY